jgi:hypothetical protein
MEMYGPRATSQSNLPHLVSILPIIHTIKGHSHFLLLTERTAVICGNKLLVKPVALSFTIYVITIDASSAEY